MAEDIEFTEEEKRIENGKRMAAMYCSECGQYKESRGFIMGDRRHPIMVSRGHEDVFGFDRIFSWIDYVVLKTTSLIKKKGNSNETYV